MLALRVILLPENSFVKEKLTTWNQDVFCDIKDRKYNLFSIMNSFDAKEDSCGHTSDEIQHRNDLMEILPNLASRLRWVQDSHNKS